MTKTTTGSRTTGTKFNQPQQHQQQPSSRFSTALVARSNNERPTELEIQLRDYCQKIRIHTQLSGAHMIFPQEQGLAIRMYYHPPYDIKKDNSSSDHSSTTDGIDAIDDPDGILAFCYTFQWSMVLFVAPNIMHATTNNDMMSIFVQRSMRLLDHPIPPNKQHPPRFIVVPDTEQAIIAIVECADAITPMRCALRAKYIEQIRAEHYVPKDDIENIHHSGENDEAVAVHYAKAIREWCVRANVPDGEADVILHVLPTLHQLIHAINDSKNTLSHIPIEEKTKRKLRHFFTARDGDENNDNYCDDDIDPMVNNESCHLDFFPSAATVVSTPPPFPLATGLAGMFDSGIDMRHALPNHYIYSQQEGHHPYNMPQHATDDVRLPSTQHYNIPSNGYPYPPQPPQHGGYFHRVPAPYQSNIEGGMYHVGTIDPSQQQNMYVPARSDVPVYEQQQHRLSPFRYNSRQSISHQQHHSNSFPEAEKMAKLVPWGQPPRQWSPATVKTRLAVEQQVPAYFQPPQTNDHHHHHYSMMYSPYHQDGNMYPSVSVPPQQPHQPVRRSSTLYPTPRAGFTQQYSAYPPPALAPPSNIPTGATTITPHDSNYHGRRSTMDHQRNESSLKHIVRRFM